MSSEEKAKSSLRRAVASDEHRRRDFVVAVLIACTVAVNGAFIANLVLPVFELWWFDLSAYPVWPGSSPFVGTYWLTAWLLGAFVPGVVVSWLLTRAVHRRWFRLMAGCFAVGCLAVIVVTLWFWPTKAEMSLSVEQFQQLSNPDQKVPFPLVHIIGLAAGILGASSVALGKVRCINSSSRARLGLLGLTSVFTIALGLPTFGETWAEYQPQSLPDFEIELVAAYPLQDRPAGPGQMPAVVVDVNGKIGEIVEYDGLRYNLHRTDSLIVGSDRVQRVRWYNAHDGEPYISVRPDRHLTAELRERSIKRMSQHDALFVDGRLISVPLYQSVITDRLWLHKPNSAEQRRLFELLTGPNAENDK